MGTLHEVYQLKPRVINPGAILKVCKDKENLFLEKHPINKNIYNKSQGFSSDTFITNSNDGKVERVAMYATERIIDFEEPGIYISIQDGSKYGFVNFENFLTDLTPYLDDALFYVIWDFIISRYEIKNRKLYFKSTEDFALWDYNFEKYVLANYASSKQLIAEFYIEKTNEMILRHVEMIKNGENPKEWYHEMEDYEDLLNKLYHYKERIPTVKFQELEDWLKVQMETYF